MQIQVESLERTLKAKSTDRSALKDITQKIFQASRVINYFAEAQHLLKKRNRSKTVDVGAAVDRAIFQLAWNLERRGFPIKPDIKWERDSNRSYPVKTTLHILDLVIAELLENAVVFGDGAVTIALHDTGKTISLHISNHGNLTPNEVKVALTQFESSGDNAGAGLGLHLVQVFAAAVGGTFQISSKQGTVTVVLELKK